MTKKRDYYEVLGLDKTATAEDIKKAYVAGQGVHRICTLTIKRPRRASARSTKANEVLQTLKARGL